ncbi:MAG TPA: choice-of-anchor J domain-containing protein [Brumimicrobium sp.]|nr:choice-of-anchor J domain-containing protein [Brumimicrobium sp.]
MKNIFTGLAIIASATLFGQVTILEENFDSISLPTDWTVIDNDGFTVENSVQEYTSAWISKEDPLNAGNRTASSTSFFSPVNRADRWLVSPKLTLGATANYISWKGLSHDSSFPDSYKVMVSKTGNSLADFKDTLVVVSNETPYWRSHTELLDVYANEEIYIAFVNTTSNGFKLYLDSVYVREQDPLSVSKEEISVGIYPNPIEGVFYISTGNALIQNVRMYNSFGQEVLNKIVDSQKQNVAIDGTDLKSGVYIVAVHTSEGVVRKRIVK